MDFTYRSSLYYAVSYPSEGPSIIRYSRSNERLANEALRILPGLSLQPGRKRRKNPGPAIKPYLCTPHKLYVIIKRPSPSKFGPLIKINNEIITENLTKIKCLVFFELVNWFSCYSWMNI